MLTQAQKDQIKLKISRAKNLTLFGAAADGTPWNTYLPRVLQEQLDSDNEEGDKEAAKMIKAARSGDRDERSSMNALQIETVSNFLLADMNFGRFFEVRTLAENESPAVQNTTRTEIKVGYIAQDTQRGEMTKAVKVTSETLVDLYQIATETPTYRLRDLYKGGIADQAVKTFNLEFDMRQKMEGILFDFLTGDLANGGAYGTFSNSSSNKANRVFVPHSRIAAGVLPTTNEISVGTPSTSTTFGVEVLAAIVAYAARFSGAFEDGDLVPSGDVIVPVLDLPDLAADLEIKNPASDIGEHIMKEGYLAIGRYFGVNWRLIPDNTLPRGQAYAIFNKPVGILWLKPSEDDAGEELDRRNNTGQRWMKKTFGTAIPLPWRKNIARFTYRLLA